MSNYTLRESQQQAINQTVEYFLTTPELQPEYLWNAVMRWGKCLTSLNFIYYYNHSEKRISLDKPEIKNALILTFFPATEDSWSRLFEDGEEEQDKFKSEFNFISLTNKHKPDENKTNIFFTSFQEIYNGKEKKEMFYNRQYDLIILDEYHYGAYNGRAKAALRQSLEDLTDIPDEVFENTDFYKERLSYKFRLVLTGTPYKDAITSEFSNKNVFKFNYFDEQRDRLKNGEKSDYWNCPQLKLYSVNLKLDDKQAEPSVFDKIDFLIKNSVIFGTEKNYAFTRKLPDKSSEVVSENGDLFLPKMNGASFWLVPSVSDGKKIEQYLNNNYPGKFNIINLCNTSKESLSFVRNGLQNNNGKKSIILSFNKLTLGVTIPEVENVVFLRDVTTAELYMQAGCRAKSQYSGPVKKENAYLISFNINNDFSIFTEITSNDINEAEFLKLFPIRIIEAKYSKSENKITTEVSEVTDRTNFLDALSKVPIHEMIKNSVSNRVSILADIPDDIITELNKISGIGEPKGGVIPTSIPEEKFFSDIEKAKRKGKRDGRFDKQSGLSLDVSRHIGNIKNSYELKIAYEKGYIDGYNYRKSSNDKEKDENEDNPSSAVKKIQLLIKRFLYILIGDYYRENKFLDIENPENAPEEFFSAMLGFKRDLFIKLYTMFIIDNDYINTIVSTFKNRENRSTPYIGLSLETDYEMEDVLEVNSVDIIKKESNVVESIVEIAKDIKNINELNNTVEKIEPTEGKQKYIYIATPSEFLKGLLYCLKELKKYIPFNSERYNDIDDYLAYFGKLTQGIKIGETHREPSERLEELNGYTVNTGNNHLLFDIYKYVPVEESKSDTEFHKYLVNNGYKKIDDDVRREFFDMEASVAYKELEIYINGKPKDSFKEDEMAQLIKDHPELIEYLKKQN